MVERSLPVVDVILELCESRVEEVREAHVGVLEQVMSRVSGHVTGQSLSTLLQCLRIDVRIGGAKSPQTIALEQVSRKCILLNVGTNLGVISLVPDTIFRLYFPEPVQPGQNIGVRDVYRFSHQCLLKLLSQGVRATCGRSFAVTAHHSQMTKALFRSLPGVAEQKRVVSAVLDVAEKTDASDVLNSVQKTLRHVRTEDSAQSETSWAF